MTTSPDAKTLPDEVLEHTLSCSTDKMRALDWHIRACDLVREIKRLKIIIDRLMETQRTPGTYEECVWCRQRINNGQPACADPNQNSRCPIRPATPQRGEGG